MTPVRVEHDWLGTCLLARSSGHNGMERNESHSRILWCPIIFTRWIFGDVQVLRTSVVCSFDKLRRRVERPCARPN